MNKKELQEWVKKLEDEIELCKKEIEKSESDELRVKDGETYYYISEVGTIGEESWFSENIDFRRFYQGNIWLNKEDCKRYSRIDKDYRKLVYELNREDPIDWANVDQKKYYLCYEIEAGGCKIAGGYNQRNITQNINCSDPKLLSKAISKIGEKDLEWYLKNYRA